MGGRGSSGSRGNVGSNKNNSARVTIKKFSSNDLKSMNRKSLEIAARAVFVKNNVSSGMSNSEADYRARSLMSGNTDAQLRKYILKNQ